VPLLSWDDVFRRTNRQRAPNPSLRSQCAIDIHHEATRLDVLYRLQMEAVSRARAEEAALLTDLVQGIRPALPALTSPLLLLDTHATSRPAVLHLRAFLLFGETPLATVEEGNPKRTEGLFLLDDAGFLRVLFTGLQTLSGVGHRPFSADRLEGLQVRDVLRDHSVADVADVLERGLAVQTARRRLHLGHMQAHVERLRSLRVLLGR
jgi:hypothetical protein